MSHISTHILDVAAGNPAGGVPVRLERWSGDQWLPAGEATTDADGRARLLEIEGPLLPGEYRVTFEVGEYFSRTGTEAFYNTIPILFLVRDAAHYHVPLLLSPFGYSTYRGS